MSGAAAGKEQSNVRPFRYYDLEAAIDVLGAFITSGIRDEVEALRQEVGALRQQVESSEGTAVKDEESYLNQKEAAKFLGCSTSHIRKQRQLGHFPDPVKLSARDLRWAKSKLSQWAEQRVEESTSD